MTAVLASDRVWSAAALIVVGPVVIIAFRTPGARERWAWIAIGAGLTGLALGSLLDIADKVSSRFRGRARFGGWYDDRRPLQMIVVALTALLVVAALSAIAVLLGRTGSRPAKAAALALALPMTVGLVTMVSWHWTDAVLSQQVRGATVSDVTRWIGVIGVAAATWWAWCVQVQPADPIGEAGPCR